MTVAKAKDQFSDLLRRAEHGGERLIIHRHGKPVAALLPMSDLARIEALEEEEDLRDARAALAGAEREGTYPLEEVLRENGLEHLLLARESPPPSRLARRPAKPAASAAARRRRAKR